MLGKTVIKMSKILNTKEIRELFRSRFNHGTYDKKTYRELIKCHSHTLNKYVSQFPTIYEAETGEKFKKRPISIQYIYRLFCSRKKSIIRDFLFYLKGKTHFSYDLNHPPKPLKPTKRWTKKEWNHYWDNRTVKQAYRSKVGEFVVLIMAEYIILHNYMWASKLKTSKIKTIDSFMKDF